MPLGLLSSDIQHRGDPEVCALLLMKAVHDWEFLMVQREINPYTMEEEWTYIKRAITAPPNKAGAFCPWLQVVIAN